MKTTYKVLTSTLVVVVAIYVKNFAISYYKANEPIRSNQCGWHYESKLSPGDNPFCNYHAEGTESNLLPEAHHVQLAACLKNHGNDIAHHLDSDICYDGLRPVVVDPARPHITSDGNNNGCQHPAERLQVSLPFCLDYVTNVTAAHGTREQSIRSGKKVRPILTDLEEDWVGAHPCYCAGEQNTPASRIVFKSYRRKLEYLAHVMESSIEELERWKAMGEGTKGDVAKRDALVRLLERFDSRARLMDTRQRLRESERACRC